MHAPARNRYSATVRWAHWLTVLAVVAAYLLVRMESRLEELTKAIRELHVAIVNRGGV